MAEIIDSLSKLIDKVDVSRRSINALSLGGCIVSGAVLLLVDKPLTVTFSGTAWNLPLVGLLLCSWIVAASIVYSALGSLSRYVLRIIDKERQRIERVERTIVLNELDDIIRENAPLDFLLENGFESSLGRNGFRINLSEDIRAGNENLMQGIIELVSRGGATLTRESPSSNVHFLMLDPDLFEYRLQWTWSAMRGDDGSELDHLRVTRLTERDLFRKKILSLIGS